MRILAMDTSTNFLSLACLDGSKTVSLVHENAGTKHSEIIVFKIKEMLESIQWKIGDIDLIAFGMGPGSFTGLRIGASTVKGFALALKTKLVSVPTLDAVAARWSSGAGLVVPVIDAHKGKVYSCVYAKKTSDRLERKTDYLLCDVDELKGYITQKAVFFGSGIDKYRDKIEKWPMVEIKEDLDWFPRADDIGRMGLELSASSLVSPESLEPMYLYPKECNVIR